VRIDLPLQRVKPRLQQQPLLLLERLLNAHRIPYLQRNAHDHRCARPHRDRDVPARFRQGEQLMRIAHGQPPVDHLQGNDQHHQQNLPVKARLAQVAPHPLVNAQINERRERPDLVLLYKPTEDTGNQRHAHVKWQRQKFMMQHRRQRQQTRARRRRGRPQQDAQQNAGLKGNIRGIKIGHVKTNPHAQAQRHADERQQAQRLRRRAPLGKQQIHKGARTRQRA